MDRILPGYSAPSSERISPRRLSADSPNLEARWVLAAQAGYTLTFDELVARNQDRIYVPDTRAKPPSINARRQKAS